MCCVIQLPILVGCHPFSDWEDVGIKSCHHVVGHLSVSKQEGKIGNMKKCYSQAAIKFNK